MQNLMLDTNRWEDAGEVYNVEELVYTENTTAVTLKFKDGRERIVPENVIRKLDVEQ